MRGDVPSRPLPAPSHDADAIQPPARQGCVVHLLLGTEGGGIVTTTRQWVPLLARAGWDIRFVSLAESRLCDMLRAASIEPLVVRMGRAGRFTRLASKLKPLKPALIHTHNPSAHLMALAVRRRMRTPVVRTVHADMFHEMRGTLPAWRIWLWKQAMKWAYPRTDLVTIVSPHLAGLLPGVSDPKSVHFIPNSYAPTEIERDNRPLEAELAAWLGDAPLVLAMGRLVRVKNFDLLLRAWQRVANEYPEARLVIAGSGPKEPHLRSLVHELRIGGSVRIQSWVLATVPLIKRASMITISSTSECYPMLAFEAMAAAKPVVSTRLDGLQVEHDRSAIVVPRDDPDSFAEAICLLLSDPARASRIGAQGQLDLATRFAPQQTAVRMSREYNDLLVR